MLKVVGASWLQTRISTYIIATVATIGVGAIILSEFGKRVENDGIYSARVVYNRKSGYRVDFWGQNNDLMSLPMGTARAYFKHRTHKTGWSILEIETSPNYPDEIQAFAAGLLEGSLTWLLIHLHWFNTIATVCVGDRRETCDIIRQQLRENSQVARTHAKLLGAEDPFWHMVRLFYAQLDGLKEGWNYELTRNQQEVEIPDEDFIWLAMVSDLSNFGLHDSQRAGIGGIFFKNLTQESDVEPLLALVHNTAAPYRKMLRLLKKYTFGYHINSEKNSKRVPTRSIVTSSYPGALSSQDEYYGLLKEDTKDLMILAGTPLTIKTESHDNLEDSKSENNIQSSKPNVVMTAAKIMAANWLATDVQSWSRMIARRDGSENTRQLLQWVILRPGDSSVWVVEQHPLMTHAIDFTKIIKEKGYLFSDGNSLLINKEIHMMNMESTVKTIKNDLEKELKLIDIESNLNSEDSKNYSRVSHEEYLKLLLQSSNSSLHFKFIEKDLPTSIDTMTFRGDLETIPTAIGVIDSKITLVNSNGFVDFQATSGPAWSNDDKIPFQWSESFPGISHLGQPDKFKFPSINPHWVWF
ncbi:putative phospholipase B-like lamina ancestor [Microplitis demolitor]|uniref:putative phospholipase B-like lamina ancestor n=1 Tax=Microplitis demolitor TaxID=69319 RepID=UPI0004CD8797|nr:putative phospholipase B-like lamina ancestor [Microplitis demolitor]